MALLVPDHSRAMFARQVNSEVRNMAENPANVLIDDEDMMRARQPLNPVIAAARQAVARALAGSRWNIRRGRMA